VDSTTAPPSFASSLSERRRQPHALVLTLVSTLAADAAGRRDAARRLAAHVGADDLLLVLRDPQVDVLLPAPGFPQTLPEPRGWRALLDGCARAGHAEGAVVVPGAGQLPVTATAFAADPGTVLVLIGTGSQLNPSAVADVCLLLPLVAATLRGEAVAVAAEAQATVAREAVAETRLLAASLDHARIAVRKALADAEAANLAKDRFFAAISHELRTPLSPVVLAVVAMGARPDLPSDVREDVAMMRRNLELETRLMDDLLDLSRVASGKLRLEVQPTHIHEVLRHALDTVKSDVTGKRLAIRTELRASVDRVTGDPARLQQVFWNLLRNAIKFTPEGGEIVVSTTTDEDRQRRRLVVEVRDTGQGIAAAALTRIFDAFEQGDPAVTQQFGGLGMGLAISKAVVDMHGGTIRARSDGPGLGATFAVTLDTESAAHAQASPPRAPEAQQQPAAVRSRVLLVEDHVDTARLLARLLSRSGHAVQTATSVAMALELAASAGPFDVVVSDVGLPDATGYELMRQVRDLYGLKGIALTGYGMEDDLRRSRAAGFVEHLTKPVDLRELEQAIQRVAAA
jgi:signal transduction histidine kinase